MMKQTRRVIIASFLITLLGMGCAPTVFVPEKVPTSSYETVPVAGLPRATPGKPVTIDFGDPVFDAASRITKKTFGLYVTPKNSPVSPERFTGYHSGVDFETTASEQDVDVPVDAVCTGKIVLKKWASGYGGVLAQRCAFDGNEVVVIYGHMKLASVKVSIGDELVRGGKIGVLGKGYSTETDGERKHLHLGIHTGSTITILGYVQKESQLADWIVWPGK